LRMISDGALESELLVQSFTITDTRTTEKIKSLRQITKQEERGRIRRSRVQ